MPEYPESVNYPSTPDQYDHHYEAADLNGPERHTYVVKPVRRKAYSYAHEVSKVYQDTEGNVSNGTRVALYETLEQAQYVANELNRWSDKEL